MILIVGCIAGCHSDYRTDSGSTLPAEGSDGGLPSGPSPLDRLCGAAPTACGKLRATAVENLLRVKLRLEAQLAGRAGHPFVCAASAGDCIAAYAELLSVDWGRSRIAPNQLIVLAGDAPSGSPADHAVLSLHEDPSELESMLGAQPAPAPDVVTGALDGLEDPDLADTAPPTCDTGQAFYDRLFADDEVEATIVFGYLDKHLDSIVGFILCVVLKLHPVPVYLNQQEQLLTTMRSMFVANGFVEASSSPSGLELSRKFYYRQRLKTLRVHVIFSLADCPNEAVDPDGQRWRYDNQTCAEQQRATAHARAQFTDAFATSAVILYHGHARLGRGLDFGPLGLDDGKLKLDCSSLACDRAGPAQSLLFIDGCDTLPLYAGSVAQLRRDLPADHALAWLGNHGDVQTLNAPQTSLRLMDMLVEAKCPKEMLAVLNLPKRYFEGSARVEAEGF